MIVGETRKEGIVRLWLSSSDAAGDATKLLQLKFLEVWRVARTNGMWLEHVWLICLTSRGWGSVLPGVVSVRTRFSPAVIADDCGLTKVLILKGLHSKLSPVD